LTLDAVAAVDPLPAPEGEEIHDGDRRTWIEAAEVLVT
jgi:hypothetical protein